MNKKDVCKLKPGTWIEILWEDSPPSVALVIAKPEMRKGDVSVPAFYPEHGTFDSHAVHTQVSHVLTDGVIPKPISPEHRRYGDK